MGCRCSVEINKNSSSYDEEEFLFISIGIFICQSNLLFNRFQVQASKHTGAGADEVYVPTLWYFDALNFLGSRTESCRTVTDSLENEVSKINM